ncbi:chymotrypsin-2-like [Arctopsyche grandis]|uniref:chymotrypsin-2-like n=1 Tax=Arctopsyche grandis TaxID=121162 RepID=UPI00406D9002
MQKYYSEHKVLKKEFKMPNIYLALLIMGVLAGSSFGDVENRIIGGTPVSSPVTQAVSVLNLNLEHVCGGTIINSKWVLTSATCARTSGIKYIMAGATSIPNSDYVFHIWEIITHPDFNSEDDLNNIGMLKTLQTIIYTSRVGAANLPYYSVGSGTAMIISGWGRTSKTDASFSSSIRSLTVKSMSREECRLDMEPPREIYDRQLCGVRSTGKGVCTGDSGSGVIASGYVHGIVARTSSVENCALGYPEVFTRVYPFVSWINQVISNN